MFYTIPVIVSSDAQTGYEQTAAITGVYGGDNTSNNCISSLVTGQEWEMCGITANSEVIDVFGSIYLNYPNLFLFACPYIAGRCLWNFSSNTYTKTEFIPRTVTFNGKEYAMTIGTTMGTYYTGYYASAANDKYSSLQEALSAMQIRPIVEMYPITYSYTNSTVSGPSEAGVGDTVTVSAVPDNNYGITDPASQILVTNNDVAVEYQWNPSTNTITFTMPDPS